MKKHPLLRAAEKAIASRRLKKAQRLAFLAWSCPSGPIPADALEHATPQEWAQLVEAARASSGEKFGVPSAVTQKLVIAKLREHEQRERRA